MTVDVVADRYTATEWAGIADALRNVADQYGVPIPTATDDEIREAVQSFIAADDIAPMPPGLLVQTLAPRMRAACFRFRTEEPL